jgi:hypothetical protein
MNSSLNYTFSFANFDLVFIFACIMSNKTVLPMLQQLKHSIMSNNAEDISDYDYQIPHVLTTTSYVLEISSMITKCLGLWRDINVLRQAWTTLSTGDITDISDILELTFHAGETSVKSLPYVNTNYMGAFEHGDSRLRDTSHSLLSPTDRKSDISHEEFQSIIEKQQMLVANLKDIKAGLSNLLRPGSSSSMTGGYISAPESLLNNYNVRTLLEETIDQIEATTKIVTDLSKRVKDWGVLKGYPRSSFAHVRLAEPTPPCSFEPRPWKLNEAHWNSQISSESSSFALPECNSPFSEDQVNSTSNPTPEPPTLLVEDDFVDAMLLDQDSNQIPEPPTQLSKDESDNGMLLDTEDVRPSSQPLYISRKPGDYCLGALRLQRDKSLTVRDLIDKNDCPVSGTATLFICKYCSLELDASLWEGIVSEEGQSVIAGQHVQARASLFDSKAMFKCFACEGTENNPELRTAVEFMEHLEIHKVERSCDLIDSGNYVALLNAHICLTG